MATDDMELVRDYAARQSEPAFETLVARYVNLIYSAALRQVGDPHLAEEVTQAVFIILARKAGSLGAKTILPSWLHRTACYTAAVALKIQRRREQREQEAHMQSLLNEPENETWTQIAPLLDTAIAGLNEKDRHAIVLRFFEKKSMSEIGQAIGANENAAKTRVNRALEKLRKFFTRRGVSSTTGIIAGAMAVNSVQAAPVALAKTVTTVTIAKGAVASGSTLILVKGALKLMAWTKAQTAIVIGTAVLLAAGTTTVVVKDLAKSEAASVTERLSPEDAYLTGEFHGNVNDAPPALFVRTTRFPTKQGLWGCESYETSNFAIVAGRNVEFTGLFTVAYHFRPARMILPPNVPTNHFDFLSTLPHSSPEVFQAAIKNTLGWTAHAEIRETNVLLLKVKIADAPGLIPGVATNHSSRWENGGNVYHVTNMPISDLREFLEDKIFRQPVLDQTGLTNKYDIILDWHAPPYPTQSYENSDSLKKVLLEQLGLELVPGRKRIEMLVVERTNTLGSTKTNDPKF